MQAAAAMIVPLECLTHAKGNADDEVFAKAVLEAVEDFAARPGRWNRNAAGSRLLVELNTDFSTKGLSALEIQSIVAAWQSGAISRDTMTELFRRGEDLPEGRSMEEEERLITANQRPVTASPGVGRGK